MRNRASGISMAAISGVCVNVVVWERQRRDGGYSPFPPHDSAIIEAACGAQSSSCNVGGLRVDLKNMKIKQTARRSECKVQRYPTSIPASPPILAYWTWDEGHANFAVYSIEAILDIEQAYQQKRPVVDLSLCLCRLPYTLDFTIMKQTRHGYQTQRTIKREPLNHGQSLQSLLAPVSVGHTDTVAPVASGTGMFSLATGPATNILNSMSAAVSVAHSMITRSSYSQPATYIQPAPSYTQPGGSGVSTTGQTASSSSKTTGSTAAPGKGRRGKKGVAVSSSPPLGRRGKDDSGVSQVPEYAVIEKTLDKDDDGPCPICMCQLSEKSGYDDEGGGVGVEMRPIPYAPPVDLCKLRKCGHMMHRPCLLMMLKSESTKNGLTCPTCKKVYGTKTGDMPDGSMTVRHTRGSLPGHEGSGTIEIVYNFSPGVHNGRHYRANGFPRTCYLPDTEKGQKVLRLLQIAWERRLTFTIGTSVTTGATDTVVWNEIHHKTESSSNHSGHGYPDPNYLDNVLMELSLQGVTESDSEPATSDESL